MNLNPLRTALAGAAFLAINTTTHAQIAYGVDGTGLLFRFDVDAPSVVANVGALGFVPEGIDFRPGSSSLYAIDVGPSLTQLYTISLLNGAATPVGAGFSTIGSNYDLSLNRTFGFDFNPTTLQPDNSMRIRLVGSSGTNLRLNSSSGGLAAVDGALNPGSPAIDAAAYINNLPRAGGTTTLFDLDPATDRLLTQSPPNNGTLNVVGSLGFTVDGIANIGFDIYTDPSDVDSTIGGDFGFAVLKRPDAPLNGPVGAYLLYDVNLGTGTIANGALVGTSQAPNDFSGGFAVAPTSVPDSGVGPWSAMSLLLGMTFLRRRTA